MEKDDSFRSGENDWVSQRYAELLNAPRHRLGDYRTIPASVVYLISSPNDHAQLYVGVTTQKGGGRFSAHIRDRRSGLRQRMKKRLEINLGRHVAEEELERTMSDLVVQWIEEPDRGCQERVEHYACAVNPPILNVIGRAKWRSRITEGGDHAPIAARKGRRPVAQTRDEEPEATLYDRETFKNFSAAQLQILAAVRRDLGAEVPRTAVRKWFQQHKNTEYAPAWIVKNRFIVRKNEHGAGGLCILDPDRMPDHPFPKIVNRSSGC